MFWLHSVDVECYKSTMYSVSYWIYVRANFRLKKQMQFLIHFILCVTEVQHTYSIERERGRLTMTIL